MRNETVSSDAGGVPGLEVNEERWRRGGAGEEPGRLTNGNPTSPTRL